MSCIPENVKKSPSIELNFKYAWTNASGVKKQRGEKDEDSSTGIFKCHITNNMTEYKPVCVYLKERGKETERKDNISRNQVQRGMGSLQWFLWWECSSYTCHGEGLGRMYVITRKFTPGAARTWVYLLVFNKRILKRHNPQERLYA